jgi:hypothetical protein
LGIASILLAAAGMLPADRLAYKHGKVPVRLKIVRQNAGHSGQNARAPR